MMSIFKRPAASFLGLVAVIGVLGGCATPMTGDAPPIGPAHSRPAPEAPPAPVAAAPGLQEPASAAQAAPASAAAVATPPAAEPPTPVAIDPLLPEREIDPDDAAARIDLWARVRRGFAMPELDNELVRRGEQWYATRPDYVARMTERSSRYLFHIVEEVEKRGMPTELALLPFIESAFNPQAMSVAKASGMWQFIPSTGKDFELTQNVFRDDRRDVLASTRAALDYLGKLHGMFGDWHLALAAYNWGEGSVQRAIARNRKAGLPTGYQSLRMPDETRYYVPKLQAVKNIIARPEAFALSLPSVENHPYFLSVPIERDIDLDLAARMAGIPLDDFKNLNPQMNRPVILAAGTPQVLLPYDNANRFVREFSAHRGPFASWTAWVAPRTMRPGDVARQVGMEESALCELNLIPPRMLVKAGSTLLVSRHAHMHTDVSEHMADNATMLLTPELPPQRRVLVKAGKRGTSVAEVARRYRLSSAQVADWNGVGSHARFAPGQQVVVYLGASGKVIQAKSRAARVKVAKRPAGRVSAVRQTAGNAVAAGKAKTPRVAAAARAPGG